MNFNDTGPRDLGRFVDDLADTAEAVNIADQQRMAAHYTRPAAPTVHAALMRAGVAAELTPPPDRGSEPTAADPATGLATPSGAGSGAGCWVDTMGFVDAQAPSWAPRPYRRPAVAPAPLQAAAQNAGRARSAPLRLLAWCSRLAFRWLAAAGRGFVLLLGRLQHRSKPTTPRTGRP